MTIFTHVTLGTNNFSAAVTFYDAVLGMLGINNIGKLHETGLSNGGASEGEPSSCSFAPNAYAAYLRDPDGNKVAVICFAPE